MTHAGSDRVAARMRAKYSGHPKRASLGNRKRWRNGPNRRSTHIQAAARKRDEFARQLYWLEMASISRMARAWRHQVTHGVSYFRQSRFAEAI